MLSVLKIRNFALVEDLEIEFTPGFNAVTGETGAGKSLLIGALTLLLGERAEKNAVRAGASEAVIEALLTVSPDTGMDAVLSDAGLDTCEDNRLQLLRIVPREGSGRNIVNGRSTTLSVFKRLGEGLVDLHGPHEHQSLFRESTRIAMLDAFGGTVQECRSFANDYRRYQELIQRRKQIAGDDGQDAIRMELLDFQTRELNEARLDAAEEAALSAELDTVANAQRIRELSGALNDTLMGDEVSAFRAVTDAQKMLSEMERIFPAASDWGQELRSVARQIKAAADDIAAATAAVEDDAERLRELENRMAIYFRLKRKYNASIPELIRKLERWNTQIEQWRDRDRILREIDQQIESAGKRLDEAGKTLGDRRRKASAKMAAAITSQLADLGLEKGLFSVSVEPAEPRANGADRVEYVFTPNPGEPSAPLQAIASSGEISRVMLAVKAVLAAHDCIPVLVFDEIDANLGGEAACAVGRKLATLARHRQVIAISHLAPVAAGAQTHFAVSKQAHGGRTRTKVERLETANRRVAELVRMLGGQAGGDTAWRHAEALLRDAAAIPTALPRHKPKNRTPQA